jgi:hypothetical protein
VEGRIVVILRRDVTSFDFMSLYPANENISDCPRLGEI